LTTGIREPVAGDGSYVTHIVQLKYLKPSEMVPIIQPFAKLANSICPIDANGILVLRDNAENVKRMLEMIEQDGRVGAGGIHLRSHPDQIRDGRRHRQRAEQPRRQRREHGQLRRFGAPRHPSTALRDPAVRRVPPEPAARNPGNNQAKSVAGIWLADDARRHPDGWHTFQQRLQSIIQRASGGQQDQIQVFGQTKIIADQRSNSLLIFATQADMERIKAVVAKLDVLLAQVLIESVIMDVGLTHSWNLGVSVAQNPKSLSPRPGKSSAAAA
jgi:general secretion pathway protein D